MSHPRFLLCVYFMLALFLFSSPALAEGTEGPVWHLEDAGLDFASHSVHYPRLVSTESGVNPERLEALNSLLQEQTGARGDTARLASVLSSPIPLVTTWEGEVYGELLSVHLHASGPVDSVEGVEDRTCVVDLSTGNLLGLSDFFSDPALAQETMKTILEERILPSLSPHLMHADLLPLPETFTVDPYGITLWYPASRYMLLSGNSGSVRFFWSELVSSLSPESNPYLEQLGVRQQFTLGEDSREHLESAIAQGVFPPVPAALGDRLQDICQRFPPASDPDNIEGYRLFSLEGADFYDVYLLTDALHVNDYTESLVLGIRADRLMLYGLLTGSTTVEAWRDALGTPDATLDLSPEEAESFRLPPGTSDFYHFGSRILRLHADESGILQSLILQ
ncbi:MAG: hypothetical protein IJ229_06500 [Clostridia bacterium]|nr:hypothetical protein [Clostridia bacterium]